MAEVSPVDHVLDRRSWSIALDGSRFLRIQQVEPEHPVTRVDLVLNWFEELKTKVAAR